MPADRLHLVRHGEVHNPDGILYGRLPDYHLSAAGHRMAESAARHLQDEGRTIRTLRCSPLERTQESAAPFQTIFGLEPVLDERVIEPWNVFEGTRMRKALRNPWNWRHLRRPSQPSWGEPYSSIVERMRAAMDELWESSAGGDAVIVSHQAPIWIMHLAVVGLPLRHDPRTRRCDLSSITSFERHDGTWHEVAYTTPAQTDDAVDVGAV